MRWYSGPMPPDFWALLAEPFPRSSCTWRVVEVADDLQTARLARTLARASIAARLDGAVGPTNWSFQLLPLGERSLVCNLSVTGVGRAGTASVARGLPTFDATLLAEYALAAAAEQFGMNPGGKAIAWVDFDAETGEPLYLPEDEGEAEGAAATLTAAAALPAELLLELSTAVPAGLPTAPGLSEDSLAPTTQPQPVEPVADSKPTGQEVIERLLDRLREEGLGKEAARLVVTYGGYGRTQAEARELYGKLRALLLSAAPVTPS